MNRLLLIFALISIPVTAGAQPFIYSETDVVEGAPATLRMAFPCYILCIPQEPYVGANDVVTWSFGDGSPNVSVTGSARVTHTFPRGVFEVSATLPYSSPASGTIFSAANPPVYVNATGPTNVLETDGAITFTLNRSGDLSVPTTVTVRRDPNYLFYNVVEDKTVVLTFAPGEITKHVSFALLNDAAYGGIQRPQFLFSATDGTRFTGTNWSYAGLVVTVTDDEPPASVTIGSVVMSEGRSSEAVFPVTLSGPLGRDWGFFVELSSLSSATPNEDFRWNWNARLAIPKGVTQLEIRIPIVDDAKPEPDEQFTFRLENYGNQSMPVVMLHPTAVCTIHNDDYTLDPPLQRVPVGTHGVLTFDVGNPAGAPATVDVTSPGDFLSVPATVPMSAGHATAAVPFDAVKPGAAYVIAGVSTLHGAVTAEARIEVVEATTIHSEPVALTLRAGETATLHVSFAPAVAQPQVVSLAWSGSAKVELPSTVIVQAAGTADIAVHALSAGAGVIAIQAPALLASTTVLTDVVDAASPLITTITPNVGTGGTRVVIDGSSFAEQCTVAVGELLANVEARSASSLTVSAPPHAPGVVDVTVTCGAAHATKAHGFTYVASRRRASR